MCKSCESAILPPEAQSTITCCLSLKAAHGILLLVNPHSGLGKLNLLLAGSVLALQHNGSQSSFDIGYPDQCHLASHIAFEPLVVKSPRAFAQRAAQCLEICLVQDPCPVINASSRPVSLPGKLIIWQLRLVLHCLSHNGRVHYVFVS